MNHNQEATRFDRIKIIVGQDGLQNLTDATVMVLGLGGVGSSCVEALARGGVGRLIVIDSDIVEITNINRQAIAFESTIGRPKADVMTAKIHQINPNCHVIAEQVEISPENCADVFSQYPKPDYVIECIDSVLAKSYIAAWCQAHDIPIVASMGAANKLDPMQLTFADIRQTMNCPLSRKMLEEYRKRGVEHLDVLFSKELPKKRILSVQVGLIH